MEAMWWVPKVGGLCPGASSEDLVPQRGAGYAHAGSSPHPVQVDTGTQQTSSEARSTPNPIRTSFPWTLQWLPVQNRGSIKEHANYCVFLRWMRLGSWGRKWPTVGPDFCTYGKKSWVPRWEGKWGKEAKCLISATVGISQSSLCDAG